jgi:hypothetical protein
MVSEELAVGHFLGQVTIAIRHAFDCGARHNVLATTEQRA